MLTVKIGDRTVGVSFSHPKCRTIVFENAEMKRKKKILDRQTTCRVFDVVGEGTEMKVTLIGAGVAVEDKFVKETGRRLALAAALQQSGLDRPARFAVWTRYWERIPPKLTLADVTRLWMNAVSERDALQATLDSITAKVDNAIAGATEGEVIA